MHELLGHHSELPVHPDELARVAVQPLLLQRRLVNQIQQNLKGLHLLHILVQIVPAQTVRNARVKHELVNLLAVHGEFYFLQLLLLFALFPPAHPVPVHFFQQLQILLLPRLDLLTILLPHCLPKTLNRGHHAPVTILYQLVPLLSHPLYLELNALGDHVHVLVMQFHLTNHLLGDSETGVFALLKVKFNLLVMPIIQLYFQLQKYQSTLL